MNLRKLFSVSLYLLFFVLISCLTGSRLTAPPTESLTTLHVKSGGTARKASDFTNSIGVNTHFGYGWSSYKFWEERLRPRLLELGVKHIRDGTYNANVIAKYKDVGNHGIRLLFITRAKDAAAKAKAIGLMLWGMEAANEPDIAAWNPDPSKPWQISATNEQQNLFKSIKSDPATKHLPVVSVSLTNLQNSPAILGDISQWMDYGNIHPYAAGDHPSRHWGWGLSMDDALERAKLVSKDKPIIATECGYHNQMGNRNHPGVSETAAAIYHLHLPFVFFNKGIARSYKYEFLDLNPDPNFDDMECHFGLIRADGTAKPSFTALKNLLTLLHDTETDFTPQPLDLSYTVVDRANNFQHTLLQKHDGSWWLALFEVVKVFDLETRQDIPTPPKSLQVTLGKKAKEINVYVPNKSIDKQRTFNSQKQFTFEAGPELVLLEIKMK